MNAAIAQHLNVLESAIIEVQEWAKVLWVRVQGVGCRFVSKKVKTMDLKQFCTEENKRHGAKRDAWNIPQEFWQAVERHLLSIGCKRTFSGELFGIDQGFMVRSYGRNHNKLYLEVKYTAKENSEVLRALAKAAVENEKY